MPEARGGGVGGDTNWLTQMQSDIGLGENVFLGLESGTGRGQTQAAVSAAKLGSNLKAFGGASGTVGSLAADVSNLTNIITGIQQGGALGYSRAAVGAGMLTGSLAPLAWQSGLATAGQTATMQAIGQYAGYAAIPLSIYNFAKNWQSGATGMDALQGAESGASIGTAIAPGIGTVIGAGVGAAVGAVSSIFGPGREDPENIGWNEYAAAYDKGGAAGVQGATPSQNFQMLAGIFDARGSNIPFYNKFGRMGENQFMSSMTGQINAALAQGKISQNSTPQQIYSQVVQPWITQMGGQQGWQNTSTVQGNSEKDAVGNLLTSIIGQWQSGQLNAQSNLGISGQTIPGLQSFGAQGSNPQAYQQQQQMIQNFSQQWQGMTNSLTTAMGVEARQ